MFLRSLRLASSVVLAGLLVAVLLLGACRPVAAPPPTPTLFQVTNADNAPAPPNNGPFFPFAVLDSAVGSTAVLAPVATQPPTPAPTPILPQPTATPEQITGPVTVAVDPAVPEEWAGPVLSILNQTAEVETANGTQPLHLLDQIDTAGAKVKLLPATEATHPLANSILAVVAPFATVRDDVPFSEIIGRWRDPAANGALLVAEDAARLLEGILGLKAAGVQTVSRSEILAQLEATPGSLGIMPFEQLDPRFKTMTVDGVNVLSNRLQVSRYPLAVTLSVEGMGSSAVAPLLQNAVSPNTNRDASKLTQFIVTGVTAMSRVTALKMDQKGYDYPARVISDVIAAADITHISNEVPFLDDCVANPTENNLTLCSDTMYWAALEAVGTDIVGLSGNHVNDFGREGAKRSITWYRDHNIPIYGSGMNVDEACAPLMWESQGNTFAFIAALAFDPPGAWATPDQPGACYYYENKDRILNMVRELSQQVDIVSVELQHQETYEPYPIPVQIQEFRELHDAGADIVSGVQSHVPQAQEPYGTEDASGPSFISYGLGNLFFDQMWSWETRTELATRHTIYAGKLLNTEILTMVLEDYAQPRWATVNERAALLKKIFDAAPARP